MGDTLGEQKCREDQPERRREGQGTVNQTVINLNPLIYRLVRLRVPIIITISH